MSRPISACERGATAVGFAFVMPLVLVVGLGVLEYTLVMFEYHRASESTRRGARTASIVEPVADLSGLVDGAPITCRASAEAIECGAAPLAAGASFDAIVAAMGTVLPALGRENVEVVYAASGIGDPSTPGGIKPLVTVNLVNLTHDLAMMQAVPGVPHRIALPTFTTTYLAGGYQPSPT